MPSDQELQSTSRNSTSRAHVAAMSKIGQGGQVVDATGEGVRLRPLAVALSDAF